MRRREPQPRPLILSNFLPVDTPLKETPEVDFAVALKDVIREGKEGDVKDLFVALTSTRRMAMWALDRDRTTVTTEDMLQRVAAYARLLRGFLAPPHPEQQNDDPNFERAKTLRHALSFVWRDLLDVKGRDWEMSDVALEEASILLACAQNLLSRVARLVLSSANAVDIHSTLRRTAGLLAEVRRLSTEAENYEFETNQEEDDDEETVVDEKENKPSSPEEKKKKKKKKGWFSSSSNKTASPEKKEYYRASTDLRLALPEAWAALALAQAQTCTLAKACSQTHIEWSLIASLCVDQVDRYGRGVDGHVEALIAAAPDAANIKEWAGKRVSHSFLKSHVETKTLYFSAIARYAMGAPLLELAVSDTDERACAKALAELGASVKQMKEAQAAATRFVATSKPITFVQDPTLPLQDSFDLIKRAYDRALQLDANIFHRGPATLSPFPERKSLITALPLPDPGIATEWTQAAWDAFDPDKLPEKPSFGVASASRECCLIS